MDVDDKDIKKLNFYQETELKDDVLVATIFVLFQEK